MTNQTQDEEYQGYSNWETWNISLWLNNDETMYNEALRICRDNPRSIRQEKVIEDYVFSLLDDKTISDKISIHRVDFKQIVKEFQQTLKELREYEVVKT